MADNVDTTKHDAQTAYYQKEQIRILKVKLQAFKDCLAVCAIPNRRKWLQAQVDDLATALYERTGTRY